MASGCPVATSAGKAGVAALPGSGNGYGYQGGV